jgi:hypothetical protein
LCGSQGASGSFWSRERGVVDIAGTSQAHAINDQEQIVGQALGPPPVAFILDRDSKMMRLPKPDQVTRGCDAMDVNQLGEVVGYCLSSRYGSPAHAMLWWPEAGSYEAVDLNVQLGIDDGHLYKNCARYDDNGLGFVDFKAVATNDRGQILVQIDCNYTFDGSQFTMGFGSLLLTPQALVNSE